MSANRKFLENRASGTEIRRLPETVDRDELEFEGPLDPICYYIVGGNELGIFLLHPLTHDLSVRPFKENSFLRILIKHY